jgi:magnesium-transporting ATPase (P-type)
MKSLHKILDLIVLTLSIIVLCVPEGIQLSVSIVFAYSISKMKDENNLVRYLGAC